MVNQFDPASSLNTPNTPELEPSRPSIASIIKGSFETAKGKLPPIETVTQLGGDILTVGCRFTRELLKTPYSLIPGFRAFRKNAWYRFFENVANFPLDIIRYHSLLGPIYGTGKRYTEDVWNTVKPDRVKQQNPGMLQKIVGRLKPVTGPNQQNMESIRV